LHSLPAVLGSVSSSISPYVCPVSTIAQSTGSISACVMEKGCMTLQRILTRLGNTCNASFLSRTEHTCACAFVKLWFESLNTNAIRPFLKKKIKTWNQYSPLRSTCSVQLDCNLCGPSLFSKQASGPTCVPVPGTFPRDRTSWAHASTTQPHP